ncbi:MAG TPA: NAD(P)-binding domain-containing protein [Burkholderiales bacterium]|nr:NAD(P)-binding domain-containing protein [Burkholderiales bacterium]
MRPRSRLTAVVIGAGQAGLAASWWLARRSIDHVVLERGDVAHSWRTERWDSLTLLTPNWQSRLPGFGYEGDDPDGFRTMAETVGFLQDYARTISAPVHAHTRVTSVRRVDDGYEIVTDQRTWRCDAVVLATGACNIPAVPAVARALPPSIAQVTPLQYRRPGDLDPGGVLVVGASASGVQIADELQRSGRQVTLAVGEHVRVPRIYRGRDIKWWMDRSGVLDQRYDEVDDIVRARHVPSLQLAGYADRRSADLNSLTSLGVKLVGRLAGVSNEGKAQFSGSLRNVCALADLKMNRLLDTVDQWAAGSGLDGGIAASHRFAATEIEESPPLLLDLARSRVRTVVWATGFRPDYSWLDVPVLDPKGGMRHDGGVVTGAPGLYVLGLPFLRKRKSSLIDGVGDDAKHVTAHLAAWLRDRASASAELIAARG